MAVETVLVCPICRFYGLEEIYYKFECPNCGAKFTQVSGLREDNTNRFYAFEFAVKALKNNSCYNTEKLKEIINKTKETKK